MGLSIGLEKNYSPTDNNPPLPVLAERSLITAAISVHVPTKIILCVVPEGLLIARNTNKKEDTRE